MLEPGWRQPDPPDARPVKTRNPWLPVIVLAIVLGLALVAAYVPIPIFWRQVPGLVEDVENLVTVDGATDYTSEGSLYLTTVSFDDSVTFVDWVLAGFDDESVVVLKDDITGGGSEEQLLKEARAQMIQSKADARNVALAELGLLRPAVRIQRVQDGSPADGQVEVGDVVLAIDGEPVYTACGVRARIAGLRVGDGLTLTVRRDGERRALRLTTESLDPARPDVPMVGVVMEEGNPVARGGPQVTIDTGQIGGPSAGLIFSLAIYDRLTPDDITDGREIAGTGGIACDGTVQAIGGIEQKIVAAERAGAEIFLAPAENYAAAKAVAEDIEVVSVADFDDAVEYLTGLS
jgi:PDZ domain-containing protein